MKQLMIIAGLLMGLITGNAYAGTEVGNGGDVLICDKSTPNNPIKSPPQFFDHYEVNEERKTPGPIYIDLGTGPTVESRVIPMIDRLERISPRRAQLYKKWYKTFWNELERIDPRKKLMDIPDTGSVAIPDNCHVEQLITQDEPIFPGQPRYKLDGVLYDQMDLDNRAMMVMHELILREARERGHRDSVMSRYLNGVLATGETDKYSLKEVIELFSILNLGQIEVNGVPIILPNPIKTKYYNYEILYFDDNHIKSAAVAFWDIENFNIRSKFTANGLNFEFFNLKHGDETQTSVKFYKSGNVESLVDDYVVNKKTKDLNFSLLLNEIVLQDNKEGKFINLSSTNSISFDLNINPSYLFNNITTKDFDLTWLSSEAHDPFYSRSNPNTGWIKSMTFIADKNGGLGYDSKNQKIDFTAKAGGHIYGEIVFNDIGVPTHFVYEDFSNGTSKIVKVELK